MYLDKRNNNKVIIVKDRDTFVIVKNLKTNNRYLVNKNCLKEIK